MYNKTYRIMPSGSVKVDPGHLLSTAKVQKTLRDADRLYEILKKQGYDVKKVGE